MCIDVRLKPFLATGIIFLLFYAVAIIVGIFLSHFSSVEIAAICIFGVLLLLNIVKVIITIKVVRFSFALAILIGITFTEIIALSVLITLCFALSFVSIATDASGWIFYLAVLSIKIYEICRILVLVKNGE